ncbi:MAG TPA: hypothetical protein VK824_08395, partial [Planctomycetota bacterium]|nr:hypothetical protein [Planctomycetota bacterium]
MSKHVVVLVLLGLALVVREASALAAPSPAPAQAGGVARPAGGAGIVNAGFEEAATKDSPFAGWSVDIGARNGGEEPLSEVTLDHKEKHGGKSSLHLSAGSATLAFRIVSQAVEARPGGRYALSAFTRTKNVRHEQNARGINQFDNC